jgi:hypothetical protein
MQGVVADPIVADAAKGPVLVRGLRAKQTARQFGSDSPASLRHEDQKTLWQPMHCGSLELTRTAVIDV